jgi:hypothetical protein
MAPSVIVMLYETSVSFYFLVRIVEATETALKFALLNQGDIQISRFKLGPKLQVAFVIIRAFQFLSQTLIYKLVSEVKYCAVEADFVIAVE